MKNASLTEKGHSVYDYFHLELSDRGWVKINPDSITYYHYRTLFMLEILANGQLMVLDSEFVEVDRVC